MKRFDRAFHRSTYCERPLLVDLLCDMADTQREQDQLRPLTQGVKCGETEVAIENVSTVRANVSSSAWLDRLWIH